MRPPLLLHKIRAEEDISLKKVIVQNLRDARLHMASVHGTNGGFGESFEQGTKRRIFRDLASSRKYRRLKVVICHEI